MRARRLTSNVSALVGARLGARRTRLSESKVRFPLARVVSDLERARQSRIVQSLRDAFAGQASRISRLTTTLSLINENQNCLFKKVAIFDNELLGSCFDFQIQILNLDACAQLEMVDIVFFSF